MSILNDEFLDSMDASTIDVAEAITLPSECYTESEFFDFEQRTLFNSEWLCVGLISRIPDPGDFFTTTTNNESLIVARDKLGEVHAFSNVCQHRGMEIVEGAGKCGTFTCPYHQWSYGLDGRLLGAPAMEKTAKFEKKNWGLPQVRIEIWKGFIFVNFDSSAQALAPTLASYEPYLKNYELDSAYCPGTFTLTNLPWNWKVMFENFNDGYHANKLHHTIQDFCPSNLASFPVKWDKDSNVIFRTNGYTHIDGGFNATTKALMPVFPLLTEEERWRSTFALIPPTLCFGTSPDQAFFFIIRPTSVSTIDVEIGYLFHPTALEHPMFDHLLQMSDAGVQVFVKQDQDATTRVQRGLRSRFAVRGRYSWQEESHVQFNNWLIKRYRQHWPDANESKSQVEVRRAVRK